MKVVTDKHGNFAIKKYFWPFTCYLDLQDPVFWWTKRSRFFPYCWSSKENALKWYYKMHPVPFKVDEEE